MNHNDLEALAVEHLAPFISGATILPGQASNSPHLVARQTQQKLWFKIARGDTHRVGITRSQPFASDSVGILNERAIVKAFVTSIKEIQDGIGKPYEKDILSSLGTRIISHALSSYANQALIAEVLEKTVSWSRKLYEGKSITCAFGFDSTSSGSTLPIQTVWDHDFAAVLSNGVDTILRLSTTGSFEGHESLPWPTSAATFCPYRLAPLADWANSGNLVAVLNRLGEILLLADGKLLFAYRNGKWHFLTPEATLKQIRRPNGPAVRSAVLETAIDVSFARTGGCIGIVTSTHASKWRTAVDSKDRLGTSIEPKARALATAINGKKFQTMDRRLRQELVAVDGATLLDHNGNVLAVGAIVHIPGGSTGGGRLAAATQLSKLGLGVKISQDGGISVFKDGASTPDVIVMQ